MEARMSQPPLGALRVFEAVARHGSFSRAASELCVTQSAVSHQMRSLEAWFGAPLFDRTGNRVVLRPHAAELGQALGRAFGDVAVACGRARRAGGPPALTIAVIPSVAICWLIPRLGAFRALRPHVELRIVYAIHGQPLDLRDADLAVVFAERWPEPAGVDVRAFLPGRAVPVSAPQLARPGPVAAMMAPGLLHDTDTTGWRAWLDAVGATDLAVAPGPVFEDFNLLRAAALAGQGLALCPAAIVAEDLREGRLVQLSATAIREHCGYYVLTAAAPPPDRAPLLAAFRDWLLSTAAESPSTCP
jgi:LysR family transcriptional regulator, glycine cleavage system transcriptional activator